MGNPRKPRAVRIAEGNRGKRPIPPELEPSSTHPECPKYLSALAKKIWERVTGELETMGILKNADMETIASYVLAAEQLELSSRAINSEGLVIDIIHYNTRTGEESYDKKPNPNIRVREKAMEAISKFGSLLAFSPLARTRITPQKESPKENPLDAFLGKPKLSAVK